MKYNNMRTVILITICCHAMPCFATNFNDGISPDAPTQDKLQRDVNYEFITQKAAGRSKTGKNRILSSGKNNAGIGNIIIGPKANLKGAIILNQSKNVDAAVISD